MLGMGTSDSAVHLIVKDLVKPEWTKTEEKHLEEVLVSPEYTIVDLCKKISSKGIYRDGFYVLYLRVTTVANIGLRLQ